MTKEKIARINELAHKSKTTGLTEAEKAEQQALRKECSPPTSARASIPTTPPLWRKTTPHSLARD